MKGHVNDYGVPRNTTAVSLFRNEAIGLWFRTLRRWSQKTRLTWERMNRLVE